MCSESSDFKMASGWAAGPVNMASMSSFVRNIPFGGFLLCFMGWARTMCCCSWRFDPCGRIKPVRLKLGKVICYVSIIKYNTKSTNHILKIQCCRKDVNICLYIKFVIKQNQYIKLLNVKVLILTASTDSRSYRANP